MDNITSTSDVIYVELPYRVNPEISRGAAHVLEWCQAYGLADDPTTLQRFQDADPSLLASYTYPDAAGADLDLTFDMMCFFLAFDDAFESALWGRPAEGARYISTLASVLYDDGITSADSPPLTVAFSDLWRRSGIGMSQQWKGRSAYVWTRYLWGYITESTGRIGGPDVGIQQYLEMRRSVIGAAPCFDMLERVHHYELPAEVWFHGDIARLRDISADIMTLGNDVASVAKDKARGDNANALILLEAQGASADAARRQVADLTFQLVEEYRHIRNGLGVVCDQLQVEPGMRDTIFRYADEILDWAGGNIAFQDKSRRYFGKAKAVLPNPEHMGKLTGVISR